MYVDECSGETETDHRAMFSEAQWENRRGKRQFNSISFLHTFISGQKLI